MTRQATEEMLVERWSAVFDLIGEKVQVSTETRAVVAALLVVAREIHRVGSIMH